ncbi:MAG: enoyl-CoA hydratase-related protein, partial [Ignavibacteria bacterium]
MTFETLLFDISDGICTITLNRPESYNAANEQLTTDLQAALAHARENTDVRCVVLTGAGKAFCSGQDLKDAPKSGDKRDLRDSLNRRYNPIVRAQRDMPKPISCGIKGVAADARLT